MKKHKIKRIFLSFVVVILSLSLFVLPCSAAAALVYAYDDSYYSCYVTSENGVYTWHDYYYSEQSPYDSKYYDFQFLINYDFGDPSAHSYSSTFNLYWVFLRLLNSLGIDTSYVEQSTALNDIMSSWYYGEYYLQDFYGPGVTIYEREYIKAFNFNFLVYSQYIFDTVFQSSSLSSDIPFFFFAYSKPLQYAWTQNLINTIQACIDSNILRVDIDPYYLVSNSVYNLNITDHITSRVLDYYVKFSFPSRSTGQIALPFAEDGEISISNSKFYLLEQSTWGFLPGKWRSKILSFMMFCISLAGLAFAFKIAGRVASGGG